MGLELQLEDVVLVNAVRLLGGADGVAQQGEAGQREVVLHTDTHSDHRHTHLTELFQMCSSH